MEGEEKKTANPGWVEVIDYALKSDKSPPLIYNVFSAGG